MSKNKFIFNIKGFCDYIVSTNNKNSIIFLSSCLQIPTSYQYALSDVNGDGIVNAADSRFVLQYSAHLIDKLPMYD